MGATDRLPSACDRCFDDRITVRSGINKDSGSFILPAFPSRVAPVGTGALGLFPELCPRPLPATYVRAGRVWNTHPKLRLRHHAEPPIDEPAHNVRHRVAASSSAADRVVPDCRGAGILVRRSHRTGPSSLTVKLVAGHGAGASGSSGRDALMPPRLEDGLWDGRVPGDRGRSGGQAPARAHPAAGAPAGGGWGPGTWVRLAGATEPCPPSR